MTLHIAPAGVFQKSGSSVEDGLHKKLLEYSGIGFTLITAMSFRLVIALLMGLVIQLTQAPSYLATESTKTCATRSQPAGCCEGFESCPCAGNTDPDQKPAPLIPATVGLKWLISPPPSANRLAVVISPPADILTFSVSPTESRSGFAGVPLSVAFCSFII